jgi:DNA-directed RNA polymerase alpha subunit
MKPITTVGELISKGERELLALHNFGQKSKLEVEERLESLGLSLTPKGGEEAVESEEEEEEA